MSATARAPGKIIFSGEHSVVYGAPALVAAVARYTTVRFQVWQRESVIDTLFKGFPKGPAYPLHALHALKNTLDERFEQFRRGQRQVQHILSRPDDLLLYTLASLAQNLPVPGRSSCGRFPMPGRLHSESELPLGAGMGSSAAAIAATIRLYEHLLDRPLSFEERFERVRFCERLQHGKGSAIDAAAVVFGGVQMLEGDQREARPLTAKHWYWLLHGIPEASTGEVVAQVRERYGRDAALWRAFATCTQELAQNLGAPQNALSENQNLLERIGVVPSATQELIAKLRRGGAVAKISGAGAHRGENGGMILIWHRDFDALKRQLEGLPYTWGALEIAPQGAELL